MDTCFLVQYCDNSINLCPNNGTQKQQLGSGGPARLQPAERSLNKTIGQREAIVGTVFDLLLSHTRYVRRRIEIRLSCTRAVFFCSVSNGSDMR